jgi:hypothetical protein
VVNRTPSKGDSRVRVTLLALSYPFILLAWLAFLNSILLFPTLSSLEQGSRGWAWVREFPPGVNTLFLISLRLAK